MRSCSASSSQSTYSASPHTENGSVTPGRPSRAFFLTCPGKLIVGDKSFTESKFKGFITEELGAHLIRPDRRDEKKRFGRLGGIRQWVESVFDTRTGQPTREDRGGRTSPSVYPRVAGRLLALAAGIWDNRLPGKSRKRSLIAYAQKDSIL